MKLWQFMKRRKKARRRRRRAPSPNPHYRAHKERARTLVHERLAYWNEQYGFSYNRVAIRDQRSRWGSCSSSKNLNFNYRIAFLPGELVDYIIVHELCHLVELNHGMAFWEHVARVLPDYRERMIALRAIRIAKIPDYEKGNDVVV